MKLWNRYTRWKQTYTLDSVEVLIGSCLTAIMALLYVLQLWEMTFGWRGFIEKSIKTDKKGQDGPALQAGRVAAEAAERAGARSSVRESMRRLSNLMLNRDVIDSFIEADERMGSKDAMIEVGALVVSIGFAFGGRGRRADELLEDRATKISVGSGRTRRSSSWA